MHFITYASAFLESQAQLVAKTFVYEGSIALIK